MPIAVMILLRNGLQEPILTIEEIKKEIIINLIGLYTDGSLKYANFENNVRLLLSTLPPRVPDNSLYRMSSMYSTLIFSGCTHPLNQHKAFSAFLCFPLVISQTGDSGI